MRRESLPAFRFEGRWQPLSSPAIAHTTVFVVHSACCNTHFSCHAQTAAEARERDAMSKTESLTLKALEKEKKLAAAIRYVLYVGHVRIHT